MVLKRQTFTDVKLHEVDFTETDLTAAVFNNCDFRAAIFDRTILENADLTTSYNYSIDPEQNRVSKAKVSLYGFKGLLEKYNLDVQE